MRKIQLIFVKMRKGFVFLERTVTYFSKKTKNKTSYLFGKKLIDQVMKCEDGFHFQN